MIKSIAFGALLGVVAVLIVGAIFLTILKLFGAFGVGIFIVISIAAVIGGFLGFVLKDTDY